MAKNWWGFDPETVPTYKFENSLLGGLISKASVPREIKALGNIRWGDVGRAVAPREMTAEALVNAQRYAAAKRMSDARARNEHQGRRGLTTLPTGPAGGTTTTTVPLPDPIGDFQRNNLTPSAVPNAVDPSSNYAQIIRDMNARKAALGGEYNRAMGELRGQYNLDQFDPSLVNIREYLLGELSGQAAAGTQAVNTAYGQGLSATDAALNQVLSRSRAGANEVGDIYRQGAAEIRSGNDAIAAQTAADYAAVGGGGPLEGAAADFAAEVAAAGPREQALQLVLGQVAAEAQRGWQSSLVGQRAADQGQLQRETAARLAGVNVSWGEKEAARQQQERAAFQENAARLASEFNQRADRTASGLDEIALTIANQRGAANDDVRKAIMQENAEKARLARELAGGIAMEQYRAQQTGSYRPSDAYTQAFAGLGAPVVVATKKDKDGNVTAQDAADPATLPLRVQAATQAALVSAKGDPDAASALMAEYYANKLDAADRAWLDLNANLGRPEKAVNLFLGRS